MASPRSSAGRAKWTHGREVRSGARGWGSAGRPEAEGTFSSAVGSRCTCLPGPVKGCGGPGASRAWKCVHRPNANEKPAAVFGVKYTDLPGSLKVLENEMGFWVIQWINI